MNQPNHEDYAEEAESAQRASAWPQAAALWQRAIDLTDGLDEREAYCRSKRECQRRVAADGQLESIARRALGIETLKTRKSDGLDFHEVSVWQLQEALRLAYQAGFDAPHNKR